MIPKECKRLAEVDLPIATISAHCVGETGGRRGRHTDLHKWWAQRPLAACRSMLLAMLLPDPCDGACPSRFKQEARDILEQVRHVKPGDEDLRKALLWFIGVFADWDLSTNRVHRKVASDLVRSAFPQDPPLVVDPFAGGGSIPFEALRLGCDALGTDLNPVACLILKVLLEDVPRYGRSLAEELRRIAKAVDEAAHRALESLYPSDSDGSEPVTYIWARTVRCESPNCGCAFPLTGSFSLRKRKGDSVALRYHVMKSGTAPDLRFEIFKPPSDKEIPSPTVSRGRATCPACKSTLTPDRVKAQLVSQHGGCDPVFDEHGTRVGGAQLLAVVLRRPGERRRSYRVANAVDYEPLIEASRRLADLRNQHLPNGVSCIPDEPLPLMSGTFNVPLYGIDNWGALFTARQKVALHEIYRLTASEASAESTKLAVMSLWKLLRYENTLAKWRHNESSETVAAALGLQALPMSWCFPEMVPWSPQAGSISDSFETVATAISRLEVVRHVGQAQQADATESPLPDDSCDVWFTDPPYYFAVPYADLSDFFFVWLKRALPDSEFLRDPFQAGNPLTPKDRELCQMAFWDEERYGHKDKVFFENGMRRVFEEGQRIIRPDGIGCVVFAHKTTEGWEALLSGLVRAGWTIRSSWPLETESRARLRAREAAALATSVHLICRPRGGEEEVGDWSDVLQELPQRVSAWIERLQAEGVRGADLVFACIGPALEIFSRYSRVETAEGREVSLAEYLEKVWEVVGRSALEQVLGREGSDSEASVGALEEDARLSALFLWTLQATDVKAEARALGSSAKELGAGNEEDDEAEARPRAIAYSLPFDVVRRFAQPLGIHLEAWEGRIIETDKGAVRLLSVSDRAKQLFGEGGAAAVAERLESDRKVSPQGLLFPEMEPPAKRGRGGRKRGRVDISEEEAQVRQEATTLDRVHAAMLLQAAGRANALRALLKAEQERGPDFGRLANALSALYPRGSHERRLLEAMLVAMPK